MVYYNLDKTKWTKNLLYWNKDLLYKDIIKLLHFENIFFLSKSFSTNPGYLYNYIIENKCCGKRGKKLFIMNNFAFWSKFSNVICSRCVLKGSTWFERVKAIADNNVKEFDIHVFTLSSIHVLVSLNSVKL